jgi:acyl-homoserine-lactone acylase
MHRPRTVALVLIGVLLSGTGCASRPAAANHARPVLEPALARQVEVIRTAYGVPHIYAEKFRALGYALGYLQVEDYGLRVPLGLVRARGELARFEGVQALESDFDQRPLYLRAVDTYMSIGRETRDMYEGFAAGVNRYVERHRDEFPDWMRPQFTGYDVAALYIYRSSQQPILQLTNAGRDGPPAPGEEGSSAWALAPGRTASNAAILLRNPHLSWTAGYWEAHAVVPGRLEFYGDFRIGGPLGIVGGFNRRLGFATTNNRVNSSEVYELDLDPERPDHYRFDGTSRPILREPITLTYRDGNGYMDETRERLSTHLGPIVQRSERTIHVVRAAEDGEFRAGEQFLRLMQASSLNEWKDAMRLRAHPTSNFIYADADGNIFYLWNGSIPVRPHPPGGMIPVRATRTDEVWTRLHDFESLPQLLNPPGGYVRNENDGPWLTNLRQPLDPGGYPPYFEQTAFGLRSQHSTLLIDNDTRLSLEDVVRLKHSYRMLLADRVKDDLLAAVRDSLGISNGVAHREDDSPAAAGVALLERWDNTAAADSRGAVLFAEWWRLYSQSFGVRGEDERALFAEPWTPAAPLATPRGLADPARAARLFPLAMQETAQRFGSWDVAWGDVHRVRRGSVDERVGGCSGALGCFRVLNFVSDQDGRRSATGGDGWVLAVEFTNPPRAYSILAYGQSAKADSPHHADQAALFARGIMKPVAFTREDVERMAERRYRPGLE